MSLIQRINTATSVVVLVVCAVVFLSFGWSATGWKALAIPTGSMRPDIPPGSLVLVHRVPVSSLKVGDVITHIDANDPKITISHRIIKAYKLDGRVPAFVTKGDANKVADTPVVGGEVIGKVVWHMPYIGRAVIGAKNPWLILPIIYIAAMLLITEEVMRLRNYWRLAIPYRVPGFAGHDNKEPNVVGKRLTQGATLTAAFVVVGAVASGSSALALLKSNTVTLANNRISVAAVKPPPNTCCPNSKNKADVNNTTAQNAHSGNVTVTGNKGNHGNVSSGNAGNSNATTITINQSNQSNC